MNSVSGMLRPRLASRFESFIAPGLPAMDEVLETALSGNVEMKQKARNDSHPAARNEPAEQKVRSIQIEQPQLGILVPPVLRRGESAQLVSPVESPLTPDHTSPIRTGDRSDGFSEISSPLTEHPSVPSELGREDQDISRPVTPLIPHTVTPQVEPERAVELHQNRDPLEMLKVYIPWTDPKSNLTADSTPVVPTANQSEHLTEHIEVTKASRLVISNIEQKLIPVIPTQGHSLQKTSQTEPPTINVTIGRIEVKATAPTTSPKRGARTSSTISLDDYLRRRQAGGS